MKHCLRSSYTHTFSLYIHYYFFLFFSAVKCPTANNWFGTREKKIKITCTDRFQLHWIQSPFYGCARAQYNIHPHYDEKVFFCIVFTLDVPEIRFGNDHFTIHNIKAHCTSSSSSSYYQWAPTAILVKCARWLFTLKIYYLFLYSLFPSHQ